MIRTLIILQVLFFLVPTTFGWLAGMTMLLSVVVGGGGRPEIAGNVAVAAIVVGLSYVLFSLWWLVFRYKSVTLSSIPKPVLGGLLAGGLVSGFFFLSSSQWFFKNTSLLATAPLKLGGMLVYAFLALGGPVVLLTTLLLVISRQGTRP